MIIVFKARRHGVHVLIKQILDKIMEHYSEEAAVLVLQLLEIFVFGGVN